MLEIINIFFNHTEKIFEETKNLPKEEMKEREKLKEMILWGAQACEYLDYFKTEKETSGKESEVYTYYWRRMLGEGHDVSFVRAMKTQLLRKNETLIRDMSCWLLQLEISPPSANLFIFKRVSWHIAESLIKLSFHRMEEVMESNMDELEAFVN